MFVGMLVAIWPLRSAESPRSELRAIDDVLGRLGLFGIAATYMPQIDHHLGELLARQN